ncbi:sigma-70 family RNA polymerase sigma factor [Paralcaligenes ureilyticus]|uniref:RNA polymerase ECF family sigma subunit n=1 Tax=Paralcaligenes ureilyticus TaxID=627131 RepID=A0A4R3M9I2_9BURK|nr:sigma-70 family RNA polymerase sigma factor [Paralcaligenes ureilyticus]TCT10251.1 RNA polymerase ECF family sigma subunit [Paralcaligenes ureilyticus]
MGHQDQDDSRWALLMTAAQNGDQNSYTRLLREITPLLRRAARRGWPSGSSADIEDIVQETLLTVHAVRHTYDPGRAFHPWLLTLLQRRTVDAVRRRTRTNRREIAMDTLDVTFTAEATNNLYDSADHETLHKAIAMLPPGQQQAIELLKQKEMSLKEASAATGTSIAALKVATHRALKTLRARLTAAK